MFRLDLEMKARSAELHVGERMVGEESEKKI